MKENKLWVLLEKCFYGLTKQNRTQVWILHDEWQRKIEIARDLLKTQGKF